MSRRTHRCLTCEGRTRHDDGVCAPCRRRGVRTVRTATGRDLRLPLTFGSDLRMLTEVKDHRAPTLAELMAGVDLTRFLTGWHGTDCPCVTCRADRIPGRSA